MTEIILEKDVIVVADLSGLRVADKVEKIEGIAKLVVENSTITPTIDPPGAAVLTEVGLLKAKILKHTTMEETLKAYTLEIKVDLKSLSDIIVKSWVPQAQEACHGDIVLINKLGLSVKNTKSKITTATKGRVTNSSPVITNVDSSTHLTHVISVRNSKTGKPKKPVDALQISIYGQIGGEIPIDVNKMLTFGIIDRGNYKHDFAAEDLGKAVYYIAAYISKKTKKAVAVSPVFTAFIG